MEKRRIRRGVQCVRACLGIVVTVTSAACVPSPEAPHHTVEYYRDHPDARAEMMAACAKDPGALAKTPDCVNSRVAASQADIGSLRELPPMGLSGSNANGATQAEPDASSKSDQSQ